MSIRMKLLSLIDVLLRVPPLFIIDELLRIGNGFPIGDSTYTTNSSYKSTEMEDVQVSDVPQDDSFYEAVLIAMAKFVLSCLGIITAMCVFMLRTKHLMIVYMYLLSVGIVFVSYWANVSTMKTVISSMTTTSDLPRTSILEDILSLNFKHLLDTNGSGFAVIQNYAVQGLLAFVFMYVHLGPRYHIVQRLLPTSFMAPSILAVLPAVPTSVLHHAPVFAALLPLALVKFVLWYSALAVGQTVFIGYQNTRNFINNYGLSALVETEWTRLNVPTVLRTFWMLRVWEHASMLIVDHFAEDKNGSMALGVIFGMAKNLLITGCETLMAVLGMASIVSYICHYIGCFFQWVLLIEDDEDRSIGTVSAILFYILALQTGLTGLDPEKRFIRLCRNFCLLSTALLHFVHNIVNPLLMSLSASHNPSLHRHVRALLVCAFLILFPVSLLTYLWSMHSTSTWLFAVSSFSIEVIVKVVVSLLIYFLFLIDAYRSTFWEKLDDYVYYIRASGNAVEFFFGIFLFFNGAWILFFESGGAIRAIMMCVHAYFNIWCEARAGWSVFKKRRTAVNKINSLLEAKAEQLQRLNDVCAICYQEMKSAKITHCNHFFHGVCLRKWLYVQDRCPLCHNILYQVEPLKDSAEQQGVEENAAAPIDQPPAPEPADTGAALLEAIAALPETSSEAGQNNSEENTIVREELRPSAEQMENIAR